MGINTAARLPRQMSLEVVWEGRGEGEEGRDRSRGRGKVKVKLGLCLNHYEDELTNTSLNIHYFSFHLEREKGKPTHLRVTQMNQAIIYIKRKLPVLILKEKKNDSTYLESYTEQHIKTATLSPNGKGRCQVKASHTKKKLMIIITRKRLQAAEATRRGAAEPTAVHPRSFPARVAGLG